MNVAGGRSASPASVWGYLLLLLAFAALGLFVAALATSSGLAAILGIGLVASLAGSVLAFRAAAGVLKRSGVLDGATSPVSIFAVPLSQNQVDRYIEDYRGCDRHLDRRRALSAVAGGVSSTRPTEETEPALLSA